MGNYTTDLKTYCYGICDRKGRIRFGCGYYLLSSSNRKSICSADGMSCTSAVERRVLPKRLFSATSVSMSGRTFVRGDSSVRRVGRDHVDIATSNRLVHQRGIHRSFRREIQAVSTFDSSTTIGAGSSGCSTISSVGGKLGVFFWKASHPKKPTTIKAATLAASSAPCVKRLSDRLR